MLKTRNEGLALELQFLNLFTVANLPLSTQSIKGALSIDDDWDEDDLPEVAEATWTLLHMLGSSSTRCRERENPLFGVQQWTWVNLLVFLPPKSTFLKEILSQLRIGHSKYLFFVFLY